MWAVLFSVAIGLATGTLVVVGGAAVLERMRLTSAWVLRKRLSEGVRPTDDSARDSDTQILRVVDERRSVLERLRAINSILEELEADARLAGLRWRAADIARFLVYGTTGGAMLGVLVDFPWWFTLFLGGIGTFSPLVVIGFFRRRREQQIESQMPEALDMLVSALRAGLSLHAGIQFVGGELPAPVGPEFARVYDEQRLGVEMRQALLGFQDRLGTVDARMVVLALLIQRETGGNLVEVLSNIAAVIRERMKFRDQVAVLTADSKASAYMLSALPVLLFLSIRVSNPEYVRVLIETANGRLLLLYGLMSLTVGIVLLNRFSRVEQ